MSARAALADLSILLIEDEYYLAEDSRQALEAAGAEVLGPYHNTLQASSEIKHPDCAVLDINLGDGPSFDFARHLHGRQVPLVFVTGYDAHVLPSDLRSVERLEKPIRSSALVAAVSRACGRAH